MKDVILHIRGVTKTYAQSIKVKGGHDGIENHTVLNKLDFSVEKNKVTALIGGNGSGKTTLFNIISGLTKGNEGYIEFVNGKTSILSEMAPYKIARLGIGRLFQDVHIFPELSIIENMLLADNVRLGEQPLSPFFLYSKVKAKEKVRLEKAEKIFCSLFQEDKGLLDRFTIKKNESAKSLSYGQQRILGLTMLLMADNKLLMLDEPASGVNPSLNEQIALIINKMVVEQGLTIFLIEHNMRFMAEVSDICAFLNKGRIEFIGTPKEVLENEQVKLSYLGA